LEAVCRQDFNRDDLPKVSPVAAIGSPNKACAVVGEVFCNEQAWAVSKDIIICGRRHGHHSALGKAETHISVKLSGIIIMFCNEQAWAVSKNNFKLIIIIILNIL